MKARLKPKYKTSTSQVFKSLLGSVISYIDPTKPVGEKDWEALTS